MSAWLCAVLAAGVVGPYHTSGPLQGSLRRDAPVPVYSADRRDPWNRIHHLLFGARVEATVYRPVHSTRKPPSLESFTAGHVRVRRLEGGEMPDFFFTTSGWDHLVRPGRYGALVAALEAELKALHLEGRTPEARVLFQQDLWNRFDVLAVDWQGAVPEAQPRRERLSGLLGRLIARVALPREALLRIPSNLDAIARAHREVDPDLLRPGSAWRELIRVSGDGPAVTAHAQTAGHRRVFRVFRRVPEGARDESADGTRVLLVETLLALSDAGDLVPLPLVVSVQSREIGPLHPGADRRLDLMDLPFVILHASRRALASAERPAGGLVPVAPDEPIPQVVGCFPRSPGTPLVPARKACTGCHGNEGRHLMTFSFHATRRVDSIPPDNTIAQDAVLRAKLASADFRALRAFFGRD